MNFRSPALVGAMTPSGGPAYDTDAAAYIALVEAADGAALEAGVRDAIDALVVGLKADGLWSDITTMALLCGARTLAGAIIPLRGPAPTSYNFVDGDLDRKAGLLSNGTTKYIDTNYSAGSLGQDDISMGVHTDSMISDGRRYICAAQTYHTLLGGSATSNVRHRATTTTLGTTTLSGTSGLLAVSRAGSADYTMQAFDASATITQASSSATRGNIYVFATNNLPIPSTYLTSPRIKSYFGGNALSLSAMKSRLDTFHAAIVSAIP